MRKPLTDEQKIEVATRLKAGREAKKLMQSGNGLEPDLKRPVEDSEATPQMRAHAVRVAFSKRGWPNAEHPKTVRDFLIEHNIPIL